MTERIGQQLGNYRLTRLLGQGGFAEAYLGEHLLLGTMVAIKVLHTQVTQKDVAQFQQEARLLASLKHPHIVRVFDFGIEGRTPYIVMDYAPNGTMRTRHAKGTRLSVPTVVGYIKQISQALQYAHDRKVVHRDIKPENMLIGEYGEILLSDFGIALIAQSSLYQSTKDAAGTVAYMAPEQFRSRPEQASDQYALATVVYEWLSGAVPFTEGDWIQLGYQHNYEPVPPLRASIPTLPTTVEQVVLKALAKQPEARFPTVLAFAQALEAASQQPGIHPPTLPTSSQHHASPEVHQSIKNQSIGPAQARESFYPRVLPPVLPPPTGVNQPKLKETPTTAQPSSNTILSAEVPTSPRPVTPAPVSRLVLHRRVPNKRMLFTLALVLLIVLSGGSLYFIDRKPTLAPAQATATSVANRATVTSVADSATATAEALPYAAGTASMFGFDAARTHNNPYEHTLNPTNVSRLTPLWSFAIGSSIFSSPAVAGGMVYVGSDDGKLYAFDASCRSRLPTPLELSHRKHHRVLASSCRWHSLCRL